MAPAVRSPGTGRRVTGYPAQARQQSPEPGPQAQGSPEPGLQAREFPCRGPAAQFPVRGPQAQEFPEPGPQVRVPPGQGSSPPVQPPLSFPPLPLSFLPPQWSPGLPVRLPWSERILCHRENK